MAETKEMEKDKFAVRTILDDGTDLYTDTIDVKQKLNSSSTYSSTDWDDQATVLSKLDAADSNVLETLRKSRKLYATNAVYRKIIEYYATMFLPRYMVTPRFCSVLGKTKLTGDQWQEVYNSAIEYTDGINLAVKIPEMLTQLYTEGGVFFTCFLDEETNVLDTLMLPAEYCRRIGESLYGTDVIQFNFAYFDTFGTEEQIAEVLASFPKEFSTLYKKYKNGSVDKWQRLDPRLSSCVLMNSKAIPTMLYAYMNILNYQQYTSNEISKSTAALQTIVVHHIPTYQDKLLLESTEMNALHKKLSKIVRSTPNTRLVTTIGEVSVQQLLSDSATVADNTLENAYKSIFDADGLNNGIFYGDNQYSIAASLSIDRGIVWKHIEKLMNFYNLAINNCEIDLKGYQVEITMIPISRDATATDIALLRENAKVGVGVLPFMIASGIKQKNVDSYLDMEANLDLPNRLMPLRSSNTMSTTDTADTALKEEPSTEHSTDETDDAAKEGDTSTDTTSED